MNCRLRLVSPDQPRGMRLSLLPAAWPTAWRARCAVAGLTSHQRATGEFGRRRFLFSLLGDLEWRRCVVPATGSASVPCVVRYSHVHSVFRYAVCYNGSSFPLSPNVAPRRCSKSHRWWRYDKCKSQEMVSMDGYTWRSVSQANLNTSTFLLRIHMSAQRYTLYSVIHLWSQIVGGTVRQAANIRVSRQQAIYCRLPVCCALLQAWGSRPGPPNRRAPNHELQYIY